MIHGKWKAVAQMPNGYAIEDSKGRVIAFTQCDEDDNDDNPITSQEEVEHANLIAASIIMYNYILNKADTGDIEAKNLLTTLNLLN